jgi:hypothetical protein
MSPKPFALAALAITGAALIASNPISSPLAQSPGEAAPADASAPAKRAKPTAAAARPEPQFAAPARLMAGVEFMGEDRYYPSPVFRDMNGDGLADIVIGDLTGAITVATRIPGDGPAAWGPDTPLTAADGKPLKFHNW